MCDLCMFNQCVLMFFRYDLYIFSRLRRSEAGTLEGGKSTLGLEGGTLQQGVLLHLAKGGVRLSGGYSLLINYGIGY